MHAVHGCCLQVWDQYLANHHADELIFAFGLHYYRFHADELGQHMQRHFFPRLLRDFIYDGVMSDELGEYM